MVPPIFETLCKKVKNRKVVSVRKSPSREGRGVPWKWSRRAHPEWPKLLCMSWTVDPLAICCQHRKAESHLHWQFLGIRQSLWRIIVKSLYINTASSSSPFITSPATKDRLKIAWQVRHEDHQHADERNSDVEHSETRSQNDIWQNRSEKHQQADEEHVIVEHRETRSRGDTDTHLWIACCGGGWQGLWIKSSMSLSSSAFNSPGSLTAQSQNSGLILRVQRDVHQKIQMRTQHRVLKCGNQV